MKHSAIVERQVGRRYRDMSTKFILVRQVINAVAMERAVYKGAVDDGLGGKVSGHEMPSKAVICRADLVGLQIRQRIRRRVRRELQS